MLSESCCGLWVDSQAAFEACVVLLHTCPELEIILEHVTCHVAKIACICLKEVINKNFVINKGKTAKTQRHLLNDHKVFLDACEDGNETEVQRLLKSEYNLDLLDADHNSKWKWRTPKDLITLDKKCLPTTQTIANSQTETEFLIACEDGNETKVQTYLENDVKLDLLDTEHNSPLHLAVKNKHINIIKLLLTKNPETNPYLLSQVDEDGCTAIEIAARSSLPIVKYIIAELGDRSWKTNQMNLVYSAIVNGDDNMLAFLKSQGAEYSGESTFPGSNENFLFRAVKDKKAKAVCVIMNQENLRPDKSTVRAALRTANNFLDNSQSTDKNKILHQIIVILTQFDQ